MSEIETLSQVEVLPEHLRRHAIDRLVMLSDGVFAIAVTLAAIEIRVPSADTLGAVLARMSVPLLAYVTSFIVVAVFWMSSRDLFARLLRVDRTLTALILAMLCLTALIPSSVRIAGPSTGALGGQFGFYALVMTLGGALNCVLWGYASFRAGLMLPEVTRGYRTTRIVETATLPLIFAVLLVAPNVGTLKLMGFVVAAVIVARRLIVRRLNRPQKSAVND